ncbi:MAG: 1-aminocyclopropane-1-carboxylate deaminase/D-cysteine desulfhydrase [Bacteroidetes bacterium]|nr:1-aminocyclopropane-1-carboxylate deaminase/D-cysteine desulfhydrase [Bacteroidota bacterium]
MPIQSVSPPLQLVNDAFIKNSGVQLYLLRTDLMHTAIGGNKLFKLKYNLEEAEKQTKKTIITFGGAFSNHIAATAAAGKEYGFETIGIIRGEKYPELNPTLKFAVECGMQLQYISRIDYQNKNTKEYLNSLNLQFDSFYLIPEGGSNDLGILGCKEITQYINFDFNYVCCACGTGASMAGIVLSLKKNQQALGFQSLKGKGYIKKEVGNWLQHFNYQGPANWNINEDYHFGGYAKTNSELIDFINRLEKDNNIPLDPVYTGKMMFGIYDLIQNGFFKKGENIVAIHTGGLQGNAGFEYLRSEGKKS